MKFFRMRRDMLGDGRVDVHAADGILDALPTTLFIVLMAVLGRCRDRHSARPASMEHNSRRAGGWVNRWAGRLTDFGLGPKRPRLVVQMGGRDDMNFLHLLFPPPQPADGATRRASRARGEVAGLYSKYAPQHVIPHGQGSSFSNRRKPGRLRGSRSRKFPLKMTVPLLACAPFTAPKAVRNCPWLGSKTGRGASHRAHRKVLLKRPRNQALPMMSDRRG